ncbi:unnamed protein product [Sphenostylis stenocarpa]|uniref:Uncharacterized protein n=1 Tax=Sphenostylis stenocarpa TaxID=92480 RepID=A0AA86SGJ5_9FABA|nr:unnamed protein product [Sphenostylis stenocarpa]
MAVMGPEHRNPSNSHQPYIIKASLREWHALLIRKSTRQKKKTCKSNENEKGIVVVYT